jgi:hypothetical protein
MSVGSSPKRRGPLPQPWALPPASLSGPWFVCAGPTPPQDWATRFRTGFSIQHQRGCRKSAGCRDRDQATGGTDRKGNFNTGNCSQKISACTTLRERSRHIEIAVVVLRGIPPGTFKPWSTATVGPPSHCRYVLRSPTRTSIQRLQQGEVLDLRRILIKIPSFCDLP